MRFAWKPPWPLLTWWKPCRPSAPTVLPWELTGLWKKLLCKEGIYSIRKQPMSACIFSGKKAFSFRRFQFHLSICLKTQPKAYDWNNQKNTKSKLTIMPGHSPGMDINFILTIGSFFTIFPRATDSEFLKEFWRGDI